MICLTTGNIFESRAYALVNPVSCCGIVDSNALAYKLQDKYYELYMEYLTKCRNKEITIGKLHCYDAKENIIINFPTKYDWCDSPKMSYIAAGLDSLVKLISKLKISSIAIPLFGYGNSGIDSEEVKELMFQKFYKVCRDTDIYIYQPKGVN